jgi:hypothetical protein
MLRETALTGTARSADGGIRLTVGPGGVLRTLEIRESALTEGGRRLADTVLELARLATAEVAHRARNALRAELTGLPVDMLAALGFPDEDAELAERVESTVPLTWQDM